MATSNNDREDQALAIDDTSPGCGINQLSAAERKQILSSIRSKWSDVADRLEAPSNRSHYSSICRLSTTPNLAGITLRVCSGALPTASRMSRQCRIAQPIIVQLEGVPCR